jgi:hypothetical protein
LNCASIAEKFIIAIREIVIIDSQFSSRAPCYRTQKTNSLKKFIFSAGNAIPENEKQHERKWHASMDSNYLGHPGFLLRR